MLQLSTALVCAVALHGGDPAEPAARLVDQFPQSRRVELFPPRAVAAADVEYLTWISGVWISGACVDGGSELESESIRQWATELTRLGPSWQAELFEPLHGPASEYSSRYDPAGDRSRDYAARAQDLRSLMKRRDDQAAILFDRERELLRSMLEQAEIEPAAQEAIVERTMLARTADAIDGDASLFSPHLTPNILRLLHVTATDASLDEDHRVAIRQFASDHAPRILELRRAVLESCLQSAHRSHAAMARAQARGESVRGASASAMRPVAVGAANVAALNREFLAMARTELPQEIADDLSNALEAAFLRQVYGPIAADLHAFGDLETTLLQHLDDAVLDAALALLEEDRRERLVSRDRLLHAFDRTHRLYLERGLGHLPEDKARFLEQLREHIDAGERRAATTIEIIRDLAAASPQWDPDQFEAAVNAWKAVARRRITELHSALAVYGLAPPASIERLPHAGAP